MHITTLKQRTSLSIAMTLILCMVVVVSDLSAGENSVEREEWFMDLALGMFVHWSADSQLGSVISHSMVGASDDYLDRFISDLPKTFYPERFNPDRRALFGRAARRTQGTGLGDSTRH